MRHIACGLLLAALPLCAAAESNDPHGIIVEQGKLYPEGIIPSCHASTLVELPSGDMLAAYFAGPYEGHPDCAIYLSRRRAGQTTWDLPQLVASGIRTAATESAFSYDEGLEDEFTLKTRKRKPCYNPVLYYLPQVGDPRHDMDRFVQGEGPLKAVNADGPRPEGMPDARSLASAAGFTPGTLVLDYKVGKFVQDWTGWEVRSTDNGYTWTTPHALQTDTALHQIQLGPIKNKPVILPLTHSNGISQRVSPKGTVRTQRLGGPRNMPYRILAGSSTETGGDWKFHFEYSDDGGRTWHLTYPTLDTLQCIQPSILRLADGRLKAIGRTRHGRLAQCYSDDFGTTWGEVTLSDMPNNNSGTDAITLADGRHVLVYNDSNIEGRRTPLSVAISDDAEHWTKLCDLETDDLGEYSYPCVVQASDDRVWVLYTWRRQLVGYAVLNLKNYR